MRPCYCRDHPEKQLVLKIARKDGLVDIPVTTALDSQGDGMIGAQLSTYAKITREAAQGPVDAAGKAGREFGRMVSLVATGEPNSVVHDCCKPSGLPRCSCVRLRTKDVHF